MAKIALVEDAGDTGSSDLAPVLRKTAEAPTAPVPAAPPVKEPAAAPAAVAPQAAEPKPPAKGGRRRIILATVALIAIAAGSYFGHEWWTTGRFMISTDDAYVGADAAVVAPRIAGYVAKVTAIDNSAVKAGDPLVYLDNSDQRVITAAGDQIASQQATLARIDKQIAAAQTSVDQARASITSANADRELAVADLDRATQLNASQFASKQSVQQAKAANDKAAAAVDSANAGLASAQANVEVLTAQRVEAERLLDQYQTVLAQRKLDLERTVIRAPFDGVVGNRAVESGEYVAAGQRLLALVPLTEVYIDANFKETQLAGIRPGAGAHVTVDAAAGEGFEGTVESVAPASGSVFSLLPPDNATGNFTKITQRIPVRIKVPASAIESGTLRPGLSVTVEVDSTGPGGVAG